MFFERKGSRWTGKKNLNPERRGILSSVRGEKGLSSKSKLARRRRGAEGPSEKTSQKILTEVEKPMSGKAKSHPGDSQLRPQKGPNSII